MGYALGYMARERELASASEHGRSLLAVDIPDLTMMDLARRTRAVVKLLRAVDNILRQMDRAMAPWNPPDWGLWQALLSRREGLLALELVVAEEHERALGDTGRLSLAPAHGGLSTADESSGLSVTEEG